MDLREPTKVLFVEDDAALAAQVRGYLEDHRQNGFQLTAVRCAEDATGQLSHGSFDVLLVDLATPSVARNGFLRHVQEVCPDLPVVVLTDDQDEPHAIEAVRGGAQEYLVKGRDLAPQFHRALRYAIERKRSEERVRFLAHHDPLTSLPNRGLFRSLLEQSMARARRHNTLVGLIFLDVDRFKWINDSLGHRAGDQLLHAFAQRLKGSLRESDVVARLGGDEFAVIVEDLKEADAAEKIAEKILHVADEPFLIDSHEVFVSTSMGIAIYPTLENGSSDALATAADIALYRAKDEGRNKYRVFTPDMYPECSARVRMDTELRHAVARGELILHFQPQVDISTGRVVSLEALVRWRHPRLGLLYPGDFIKVAEDSGIIVAIGDWVLQRSCEETARLHAMGFNHLKVAVNISALQFRQGSLPERVQEVLDATGLQPAALEVELTESILIENTENSRKTLERLKAKGVRVSIDDFGTGYSSLAYLHHFPLDALKIDRSFVSGLATDPGSRAISEAVVSLARALHLSVVAEGVETEEQVRLLRAMGCPLGQGFLFSRPVPAEDLPQVVATHYDVQATESVRA